MENEELLLWLRTKTNFDFAEVNCKIKGFHTFKLLNYIFLYIFLFFSFVFILIFL